MGTEGIKQANNGEIEEVLRTLRRAEAPANMFARVRSRIAARQAAPSGGWVFGITRIAAPAAVLIVAIAAGFFLLVPGDGVGELAAVPNIIAEPEIQNFAPPVQPAAADEAERPSANGAAPRITGPATDSRPRPASRSASRDYPRSAGGSEDRAATAPEESIFPPGIRPDPGVAVPTMPVDKGEFSVTEVLGLLGVRATYSDGGWRADAVERNGAAAKAGVRTGDVIVAAGSTPLTESAVFRGTTTINSLTVRRGGIVTELPLRR